ncbi:hypothetical protein KST00_07745 [Fusobacterium animalis]|uniref:hypothetical protein n=1 Tax=Fusobacterium animalis TaxID=76859 RepID=UPI0030D57E33
MAKYTENIRLAQPEGSDYYDIEVFNHNSELIDKKIGEMDNSLSTIKEGATREKAGIVQLGTEEGKALEGMMLARLAGAYGYGGDIQDEGVKNPNYIYYDRNTRKMYKCLKQNQDISANVANFVPLDNNSLLERLENLNSFDILYSKTDDFGNWKDLTISLTKPTDDTKYSHYVIYTGQGNQITNSILVTSTTHLDLYFDCYQYSNPGRVGVAFATFVNSTTVKLKILEGQASGDGIVKILAFKKV